MPIRASIEVKLDPVAAFDALVDELSLSLTGLGMEFEPGPQGRLLQGTVEVARILAWQPGERITLEWQQAEWQPADATRIEFRFEGKDGGTQITIERNAAASLLGDEGTELAGWFASEMAAPFLAAMAPARLGDWFTDRKARRPSGPQARAIYRDPIYHRPNFKAILEVLALTPSDFLLEIGCGGGAFLEEALRSGCRAAAIDHSPAMVGLAREVNREAILQKRLEISEGEADSLPYPDATFTCAVMTGVFGFLAQPLKALTEIHRVLADGGRFALFTGSKELRGTPAAPEPIASRLHFYEDAELLELARKAGFEDVQMEQPDFENFAREAGVPEEHLSLFRGRGGGQLLIARKPSHQ